MAKYKLPLILICILLSVVIFGKSIPTEIKSFFYALSLTMKNILILILPFIIFSFLFNSLIALKDKALNFVVMLLLMVFLSNFLAIFVGYGITTHAIPYLHVNLINQNSNLVLPSLWQTNISKIISNEIAIIFGIIVGLIFAFKPNDKVTELAKKISHLSSIFLKEVFLPILPIFILGFLFKLEFENVLQKLFGIYAVILFVIIATQWTYLSILYYIVSSFKANLTLTYFKNIMPATITGFSTISSAATMPVTIVATEKNIHNSNFAKLIISATANIHTIGSAIGITTLALATLNVCGKPMPGITVFTVFALYYALAKFGVAGIPGGVLIVVTPLLETYLGFSAEMIGLITAIYLLFDPFGTAANVTGNGAFAIYFNKIYKKFFDNL